MPTEADKTTQFKKWAKIYMNETFAAEMKICKATSIPFDVVKLHQESALWQASHSLFNYKISDFSPEQKPFDVFQLYRVPAYVVIFWAQKHGDKRFTLITIEQWCEERERSKRKSLTYERSCEIGRCLSL